MALTFFWRCETETLDGTHDYSAGDTTAAPTSLVELSASAARVGSLGINTPSSEDYYTFDSASIFSTSQGALGFWFNAQTWLDAAHLVWFYGTSPNDNLRIETANTNEILGRINRNGIGTKLIVTTDADLSTGTWYFIIARWHTANNDFRIEIYNNDLSLRTSIEDLTTSQSGWTDITTFGVGTTNAGNLHYIDNIFIADSYSEPIENFMTITSYTAYGSSNYEIAVPTGPVW